MEQPALKYVLRVWQRFVRRANHRDVDEFALQLFHSDSAFRAITTLHPCVDRHGHSHDVPKLHYAAYLGLANICQALLADGADVDAKFEQVGTALCCATWQSHENVIRLLLENKADVDLWAKGYGQNGEVYTPLLLTLSFWDIGTAIAELLPDAGSRLYLGEVLILAPRRGDVTIVDRLLRKGIHPDTPGEHELNRERALTIAAERGYEDIVRLLLEYSATVNLHSSPLWSKSALSAAAL